MPTEKKLRFVKFIPESFAGIDGERAKDMVIAFAGENADTRIVELEGDQGMRKTSLLNFIKAMCGGELPSNAINSIDDDMRGTVVFEHGDRTYTVRMTKSGFTVKYESDTEKGTAGSPKAHLQSIIGNIGLSPMALKDKSGKAQIEWMREVYKLTPEQMKLEKEIKDKHQKAYDGRTDVNRELKRLHKEVSDTGYYSYDDENKTFLTTGLLAADLEIIEANNFNESEINQKHQDAQKKVTQYGNAERAIGDYKLEIVRRKEEIEDLKAKLLKAEMELAATEEKLATGEEWMRNNHNPQADLDAVLEIMKKSGLVALKKKSIEEASKKFSEYESCEFQKIELDGEIEEYAQQLKEFIKATTPAIEGLEIIIGNWHPTKDEGLYYFDNPPQYWSETEAWEFFLKLCIALDIKVVLLENVTSIGSGGISVLNQFVANGGYVFGSKMDRSKKNIDISFHHQYQ